MPISKPIIVIPTMEHDVNLLYSIDVKQPSIIRITGYDKDHKNTVFFDREIGTKEKPFSGIRKLRSPLPISPNNLILSISDSKTDSTQNVKVSDISVMPLDKRVVLWNTARDREFYKFAEMIAKSEGYLPTGVYDHDGFEIKISSIIHNPDGNISTTPARMFRPYGNIEISKTHFDKMTVPMRMLILLHEYAHFRANTKDEELADSSALRIYLGMGFSESEALYAFTKIFTPANPQHFLALKARTEKLINQINGNR